METKLRFLATVFKLRVYRRVHEMLLFILPCDAPLWDIYMCILQVITVISLLLCCRRLEISKNRDIAATVKAISTKFGIVMQFHPLDRSDRRKIEILKSQAEIWCANSYA